MTIERQCMVGGHPEVVVGRGERETAEASVVRYYAEDAPTPAQDAESWQRSIELGIRCMDCGGLHGVDAFLEHRHPPTRDTCQCPPPVEYQAQTEACPECWGWLHKARGDGGCRCASTAAMSADAIEWRRMYDEGLSSVISSVNGLPVSAGDPLYVMADGRVVRTGPGFDCVIGVAEAVEPADGHEWLAGNAAASEWANGQTYTLRSLMPAPVTLTEACHYAAAKATRDDILRRAGGDIAKQWERRMAKRFGSDGQGVKP